MHGPNNPHFPEIEYKVVNYELFFAKLIWEQFIHALNKLDTKLRYKKCVKSPLQF